MDADFIEWLQSITLTEEEGEAIQVGAHHKEQILEECSLNLVGRFLTNCSYNQRVAKSLLRSVWKMGTDLRIVDVGEGLFQFKFAMEWSFEDHPLVLRRWARGMLARNVNFTSIPLWIQVWGFPFDLITMVGSGLRTVVDIDHKAFTSNQALFIRLRVEFPFIKPLSLGGVGVCCA